MPQANRPHAPGKSFSADQIHKGLLQLALGAVMISFSGVFVKVAHVGPGAAAFYRVFIGGIILLILALLRKQKFLQRPALWTLAAGCGLLYAVDLTCWHRSVHFVGPGLSTILANFQVFFLGFVGVVFLGEKLTWKLAVAVPLCFVGMFMLVGLDWRGLTADYRAGIYFGLAASVFYASYILALRRSQSGEKSLPPMANMAVVSLAAAFFALLEVAAKPSATILIPDLQSGAAMLCYGVFGQVLGSFLIARGLPFVPASRAGLILLLQPSLAFVWDVLFFGRSATVVEVSGAVLALGAIYLGSTSRS